jgi:chromosome segregation ATPase
MDDIIERLDRWWDINSGTEREKLFSDSKAEIVQLRSAIAWKDKIIADAKRERVGLIAQMEHCEVLLNDAGVQDDHHGEERPLTLDERVECLIDKIDEMQSELDDQGNAYISAVQGRKTFREAFRKQREASRLMADVLEALDAHLDDQVYGLRSSSPAKGIREADLDVPADFEHDVLITEAMWDKIRKAISDPRSSSISSPERGEGE